MDKRNGKIRTPVLMITAALFVALTISLVAFFSNRDANRTSITLPPENWQGAETTTSSEEGFVTVTAENAALVVENLKRPEYYHQTLLQVTAAETASARQTTELWVCGDVCKLITSVGGQTRHILTDGSTAYLWYRDETWNVESVALPQGVSIDDLAGILTYESIADIPVEEIAAAQYLQLTEQGGAPCLYVEAKEQGGVKRFWVDLATGLLCLADCTADGSESYRIEQTGLSVLESDDEALLRQMLLPDGSDPFATVSGKKPQG